VFSQSFQGKMKAAYVFFHGRNIGFGGGFLEEWDEIG
jgi:hypothetical protein